MLLVSLLLVTFLDRVIIGKLPKLKR